MPDEPPLDQQEEPGAPEDEKREPETDEERPEDLEPGDDDDPKGGGFRHFSDRRLKGAVRPL